MFEYLKKFFSWIKTVYSEASGNGSSTRVHIGLIIGFVLAVGSSFCVAVHMKKLTIEQFDNFLESAGTFVVTTSGPLYAVNHAGTWLQKREDNKNQPQP